MKTYMKPEIEEIYFATEAVTAGEAGDTYIEDGGEDFDS